MLFNPKRSVVALIVLAALISLTAYAVRAESPAGAGSAGDYRMLVHDYTFSRPSVERGGEWDVIELDGLPSQREPGRPEVPLCMARLLLPAGYDVVDVQVEAGPEHALTGTYRIAPAPYPVPLSSDGPFPERAYSSLAPFPDAPAGRQQVQVKRGYRTLLVPLYPVRYDPASGQLLCYENLTVRAQLRRSEGQSISGLRAPAPRQRDGESLAAMLDNPRQIDSYLAWEQPSTRGSVPLAPLYEAQYLIITNQALYDVPPPNNLQTLAAYKEGLGIATLITTTEWISTTYGSGGGDLQTRIRNYIRDVYNDRSTEYVLLAGDSDTNVPAENIVPHRGFAVSAAGESDDNIPADLYYACLDGSFDYDGDGLYGEPNDGPGGGEVDLQAEVYVGRAPVASDIELRRFVAKTIAYERSEDDYLHDVWMVGETLDDYPLVYGGDMKDDVKEGREDKYPTVGFENSDYAAFFDTETLYERDGDWTSGDILVAINSPLHLVNHVGHGSKNQVMKLYGYGQDGYNLPMLENTHYFVGYSQACDAAWFDVDDSIVEQLVLHEHGAVAFIGNARFGWYMAGSPACHVGPSQLFDRFFWDKLLDDKEFVLGRAHQLSKEALALQLETVQGADRWVYFGLNLLGDPQLTIHTTAGGAISYQGHALDDLGGNDDGALDIGEQAETIITLTSSYTQTVENVTASLSCDDAYLTVPSDTVYYGDLAGGQSSSGGGTYRVSLADDCPNQHVVACTLWITGTHVAESTKHWQEALPLEIDSQPELSFSPLAFDEELPLGESLTRTLTISNSGAGNLSADFFSYQGWLTVAPGEISVPPYAADGVSVTLSTQGFSEPGIRSGIILLHSNDADQAYTTVSVTLQTEPLLAYAGHTADDALLGDLSNGNGHLEPGEQVEMWVALRSYHDETTYDVTGTLSTEAPFVSWTRERVAYGDVQPGQVVTPSQAYSFTLASDVSGGTGITFTLVASATLEDQTRAYWQDSFVVAIERVPWIIPSPQAITATGFTGEALTRTLTLANRGSLTTPFTITVSMPDGGPTVMAEPDAGQIGPNVTRTVSVTISTPLRHFPGYYAGELLLETEDPERPIWQIPVDVWLRKRYYLSPILQTGG